MNWKNTRLIFIILIAILVILFFNFSVDFSTYNGNLSASFVLTNEAKITGILILLSFPVYRILKKKIKKNVT